MRVLRFSLVLGLLCCAAAGVQSAAGQSATLTTLAVTSGGNAVTSVAGRSVVTLTAKVTAGSTPVTPGLVEFCDAAPPHCTDIHLVGTAQLTASGTAVFSFIPAEGTHTYEAIFAGTHLAARSSASAPLTVSKGLAPTATSIPYVNSIAPGTYSVDVLVTGLGGATAPTGTVSILDTSNGNYVLTTTPVTPGSVGGGGGSLGTGFGAPIVSPAEGDSEATALADFNGDGKKDLVVGYSGLCPLNEPPTPSGVNVFLGNGDGTMSNSANFVFGACPMVIESVAVADFNGDGKEDFAVASLGAGARAVTVYLGNGDGTFGAGQTLPAGSTTAPIFVAAGDFNGDGIPDLAVINSGTDIVRVLLGNGDGTFTLKSINAAGNGPTALVVGDFNGDGVQDLAVANTVGGNLTIFLGNGDGTFIPVAQTPSTGISPTPEALTAADFNGDGLLDLAIANYGPTAPGIFKPTGLVTIMLGNGDGTFTTSEMLDGRNHLNSIAVGDFNADGKADIVVSDVGGLVQVLLSYGDGTFTLPTRYATEAGPYAVVAADFNGDGIADIAAPCNDDGGPNYFINVLPANLGSQTGTATATATTSSFFVVGTGVHKVVASYSGDSTYTGSVSALEGMTAEPEPTTLTFTASPATVNYAQPVTLTVAVSPNTAQNHSAGGTVTFTDGSTLVGTAPVVNGGATYATTVLISGVSTLTATYSGDANFIGSTATALETVNGSGSVVTLTAAPNPARVGQAVTLTVGVMGISYTTTPTGTVTLYNGTTALGQATLDATGHAVYALAPLPAGTYLLTAVYSGDALFYTGASPAVTLAVNRYPSATTLAVAPNPVAQGQPATLTAAVTGVGTAAIATGTVTFYSGATALGTGTLDATGHAVLTTAGLALGSDSLTAVYAGDAMYTGSTSAVATELVQPPTFTITLSNPSITLAAYKHTTTTVALTSEGNFNDTVSVACGSVPKFVTCIFQPGSAPLVVNGTVVVQFYLDTDSIIGGDGLSGPLASSRGDGVSGVRLAFVLAPVGLLAMFAGRRRRMKLLAALVGLTIPLAMGGCGSSVVTPVPSAAPGVYVIPVTATGMNSGVVHAAQLTLTVTP